jgi:WD40 repeat protein
MNQGNKKMTLFNLNSPIECLYQIPKGEFDIRDIIISPDCQIIASTDGVRVKLWDLHTGKLLRELVSRAGGLCWALAISPDGKTIAGLVRNIRCVWNLHTGEYLKTLEYSTELLHEFTSVAFFQIMYSDRWGYNNRLKCGIYARKKVSTRRVIGAGRPSRLESNNHLIGSSLNFVEMTKIPRTGDLYERKLPSVVCAVAISRDGQVCAAGLFDGTIKFWQWGTYAQLHRIQAHSDMMGSIAFSSDGQTLVSGGWDKSIKFWNVKTGELQRTISENLGKVYEMALSADDRTLVTYDNQKTVVPAQERIKMIKPNSKKSRHLEL